jgi:excinuclease UvrABC nuclease subunit
LALREKGSRATIESSKAEEETIDRYCGGECSPGLEQLRLNKSRSRQLTEALKQIQRNLPCPPSRIEGYDISNIQGQDAVGSMVVFEDGRPKPAHYRRFKIKTVSGETIMRCEEMLAPVRELFLRIVIT